MDGWLGWSQSLDIYMQFTRLRILNIFGRGKDTATLNFKLNAIATTIRKAHISKKEAQPAKKYAPPKISRICVPTAVQWQGNMDDWIIYKYPKGYLSSYMPRREHQGRENSLEEEDSTLILQGSVKRRRIESGAERRTRRKLSSRSPSYEKEGSQPRSENPPQLSAEVVFAKIRKNPELARTPTPESTSINNSPPTNSAAFRNLLDEFDYLRTFMDDSPKSPVQTFIEPRLVVSDPAEDLVDLTQRELDFTMDDVAEVENNVLISEELNDLLSMPLLNHKELFSSKACPETEGRKLENFIGSANFPSSPVQKEPEEYQFINMEISDQLFREINDNAKLDSRSAKDTEPFNLPSANFEIIIPFYSPQPPSAISEPSTDSEEEYIPLQFMAERKTPSGLQYLVQWQDCPLEKDWTWEPAYSMKDSVPSLVTAWNTRKTSTLSEDKEKIPVVDYIVEMILGKRKFKGVPHYLVKWKDFDAVEDRTWEPCERLAIDVPGLVEDFEEKKRKK